MRRRDGAHKKHCLYYNVAFFVQKSIARPVFPRFPSERNSQEKSRTWSRIARKSSFSLIILPFFRFAGLKKSGYDAKVEKTETQTTSKAALSGRLTGIRHERKNIFVDFPE